MKLHEIFKSNDAEYRKVVDWYNRFVAPIEEEIGEVLDVRDGVLHQGGALTIEDSSGNHQLETPPCKVKADWLRLNDIDLSNVDNFDWLEIELGISITYASFKPTIGKGWAAILGLMKRFPEAMFKIEADKDDPPENGIFEYAIGHKRFVLNVYDGDVDGNMVMDLDAGYVEFPLTGHQDFAFENEFELQDLLIQNGLENWV